MTALRHIILPDSGADLLRPEIEAACQALGLKVSRVHPRFFQPPPPPAQGDQTASLLDDLLAEGPALILSVNFQGLGHLRFLLEKMDSHKARAAVWCVDNPWNVLSGMRDPRWRSLPLFIADKGFLPQLIRHGALDVFFLPLAANAQSGPPIPADPPNQSLAPFVFVGRSSFPDKAAFFAGIHLPPEIAAQSTALLDEGRRPDLFWWEDRLYRGKQWASLESPGPAPAGRSAGTHPDQRPVRFWPGKLARVPALGAAESALGWRSLCLHWAARTGAELKGPCAAALDIFGDQGWAANLPPNTRLHPPCDYYTALPGLYRQARFSLCLASMQLPCGLTQRHFDVWMAGGVGLSDDSPGLEIFPDELVRAIRFRKPEEIGKAAQKAENFPGGRSGLVEEWRGALLENHTYVHRIKSLLQTVES